MGFYRREHGGSRTREEVNHLSKCSGITGEEGIDGIETSLEDLDVETTSPGMLSLRRHDLASYVIVVILVDRACHVLVPFGRSEA